MQLYTFLYILYFQIVNEVLLSVCHFNSILIKIQEFKIISQLNSKQGMIYQLKVAQVGIINS